MLIAGESGEVLPLFNPMARNFADLVVPGGDLKTEIVTLYSPKPPATVCVAKLPS